MLSLAKMAALCSSDDLSNEIVDISNSLQIIQFQEELPISVLTAYGYDINNMRVLSPQEIIQV